MTKRVKWAIAGACVALALAAIVLVVWRMHERRLAEETARLQAEAEARAAAEREALYRQFGIDAPGTRRFVPLPSILSHNHGRAEIGRKLFNDRRLTSSQKSQSLVCGACHWLGAGGTDSRIHHGVLTRPVYNASFATVYLHDGSVSNLPAAVTKMIEHPHFSGGGPLARVVSRLAGDEVIVRRFTTVYGQDGLAGTNVVDAVVEYMKTLTTVGTPYDFWCAGHADAFTPEQQRGSEVFLTAKCMDCHDGPVLGARKVSRGRKVSALRGLGLRKAYLTEGKVKDLDAVVPMMPGGDALSPEDRKVLVEFLKAL